MADTPVTDCCKVPAPNCDSFALMKLPAELRDRIYGCYFARINRKEWFLNAAPNSKTLWHTRLLPKTKTSLEALGGLLPLLHASRKLRAEAGQIFYKQHLANAEFLFNINCHNAADNFRRMQAICMSFAAFSTGTKKVKFGIQIFTNAADEVLLLDLADCMHQFAARDLQRKWCSAYRLEDVDNRIDSDTLAEFGQDDDEGAFRAYNLEKMPSFAELESNSDERLSWPIIPGLKVEFDKRSFRMFGPLAIIDWGYFDYEKVSRQLPSTDDYEEFVHEAQSDRGADLSDSDEEPEEKSFYDTLELESDGEGGYTDDEACGEYGNRDDLDDDGQFDY
jgi:hypothetical protein